MGNYNNSEADYQNVGGLGGGYGFGGGGLFILIAIIIMWLLFRDGHRGERGDGYGHGCGEPTRPMFFDESNYEEER